MSYPTNFSFPSWINSANYKQFDVVDGVAKEAYYYATQDNTNQNPLNNWSLNVSSVQTSNGTTRVTATSTINPPLARGSYVLVNGLGALNYTGVVTDGGPNFIEYPASYPDSSSTPVGATISSNLNPAWSSGFCFIPSYSTNLSTETQMIKTQFEGGYSQRMRKGLNSNVETRTLVFEERTDREAIAILNCVEAAGGVDPLKVVLGASAIGGKTNNRYSITEPKVQPKAKNINTITVTATQVFDTL
jgi:phage-related protein